MRTPHAPARRRRIVNAGAAAALAFGGVLAAAPGCSGSSCVNGNCTVTFRDGATRTDFGGRGDTRVPVLLTGVESGRVSLSVDGVPVTVIKGGAPQRAAGYKVVATEVSAKKVVLRFSP
ncbi:hypothetical protein ACFVH6_23100 [Spirillospora sp. NPDC127200]